MLGGLGLHVLGIRHDYFLSHWNLKLLTLFMVDDLPVHNGERGTGIIGLADDLGLEIGEGEFADDEGVLEDKPLHIFTAGRLSVAAHVHEPTVAH